LFRGKERFAVHENHVAANVELWRIVSEFNPLSKGPASCHQCGGSHNPVLVRVQDGEINAGGEAKVVGVDNQTAHAASLTAAKSATDPKAQRKRTHEM
jgi:hypothetical protein